MWHYVYVIENDYGRQYVGHSDNIQNRLIEHNKGNVRSTAKFRPWRIAHAASFPREELAIAYERYLKSGSGTTFRHRHLVPDKRSEKIETNV